MPAPRKSQIAVEATPYYHCVSRCVRRAFLCGKDRFTGRSFEHRRAFIESELLRLGQVFYLQVVAYSVMSNHYHVILFIDQSAQREATTHDVIYRWHQMHKGNSVSEKFLNNEPLDKHERKQLDTYVDLWRSRLGSISWYMRVLNEKVARMANTEDEVTGRFWEGRFKCQALLDDQALLSCMAYVDLNPVRAGIVHSPKTSAHTSIKRRIDCWEKCAAEPNSIDGTENQRGNGCQPLDLYPFLGNVSACSQKGIPLSVIDYLELVDWTGRQIKEGKTGAIREHASPILQRLSISPEHWIYLCSHFESKFKGLVGSLHSLEEACEKFKKKRRPNLSACVSLFT